MIRTPHKMVNTRSAVKKEKDRQNRNVEQALKNGSDADKQLPDNPADADHDADIKEFETTYVATDPVAGTSTNLVLDLAEKVPPHPPGSRQGSSSRSKKSTSTSYQLIAERKKLEIQAAEELARIQTELVKKKLAAELEALEEKYSHTSSKESEMRDDNNRVEEWIDQGLQANPKQLEKQRARSCPTVPKIAPETNATLLLAQALNNLSSSTKNHDQYLISRLSTPRELPIFSGDAMEWLNFKQAFDESSEVCNYSIKENQWRLRKCLVGPAREAVSALLMSGAAPDIIMSTLELQFGNSDAIIAKIMSDIKKLPPLPPNYICDLVKFSIKIKNFVAAVRTLGREEYLEGVSICSIILSKLPTALLTKWSDFIHYHKTTYKDTKLDSLSRFLSEEATKIAEAGISQIHTINYIDKGTSKQHANVVINQQEKCKYCKLSSHSLVNCKVFKRSLRKERWNFVRNNAICFKCLSRNHDKESCPAPMCDKDGCGQPHHTLLHYPLQPAAAQAPPRRVHAVDAEVAADTPEPGAASQGSLSDGEQGPEATVANVNINNNKVLLKIVRVNIHGPKGVITAHALLDDGATVSLISADLVDQLNLTGKSETLRLRGAWNSGEILCKSELIDLKLSNENSELFDLRARKISQLDLPVQKLTKIDINNYDYLCNIKKYLQNINVKPQLLIGQDNYHLMIPLRIISRSHREPCATLTPLGWCVHGLIMSPHIQRSLNQRLALSKPVDQVVLRHPVDASAPMPSGGLAARAANLAPRERFPPSPARTADLPATPIEESHTILYIDSGECAITHNEEKILHEMVRQYFALESIGICHKTRENKEEQRALSLLNDTAKMVNGQWEVGLPWRTEEKLDSSLPNAEKRFRSIENKLRNNKEYAQRYRERVQHLLENDYAREVTDSTDTGNRIWYLPHFGVDNPRKKKLRLVFDAAATVNGKSLNDYLLQGPDLLQSLYGIMLRFRENRIGVTGDIRDMFLRIKIRKEDQNALRFLWRDTDAQPTKHYAMTSLIFGANCSPFIAQFIKNKNAQLFSKTKPEAVRAIVSSHYMDDYIDSMSTESEAIKLINDISSVHSYGGFEMRGWTSNINNVLSHLPREKLSDNIKCHVINGENTSQRTLGMLWDPAEDSLAVDVALKNIPDDILEFRRIPTKREVLRIAMSIYDIYGILSPVTVQGKILLRSIWKTDLIWDNKLTKDLFIDFQDWINDLKQVIDLRVPRWFFSLAHTSADVDAKEMAGELQLHVFCDASPSSYSAVAYWRLTKTSGKVCVSFIACKNRIAPTKLVSVPRLELQGALLAARLAKTIRDEHRFKSKQTYYWTDSTTVLHWLRNENRNYKEYIANRLGEIDELTSCFDWRYVPSQMNIADLATKKTQYKLHSDCSWLKGPAFLYCKEDEWPENIISSDLVDKENLELALVVHQETENLNIPEPSRFSSWIRLLRATAAVLKFIYKLKKENDYLEAITVERAEFLILKYSQRQSFKEEITLLKERKSLNKDHLPVLRTLSPYLDESGLMRAEGRIDAASNVGPETKKPIILEGRNYIVRLLVKYYHEKAAHGYNEMVVNELKQKYWIIRVRPTVKAVAAECLTCKINKAKPVIPRMGELPEARLAHHQRPFSYCGVDLFGPMEVTIGRRREKRYGVLFTCLTVRAVHIELVHTLTTDSLILALRRMAARRGWPQNLFSDNGTNLRGANTELKLAIQELDEVTLTSETANRGIRWSFIPPASPHMAGAWERLIRSIKTSLKATLKERAPREEVLTTLLAEAENMANTRPLTHVSVEPGCPEGLTPNHFLLGASSNMPQIGMFDDSDFYLKRQWRIAQRLADQYWRRWVKEVLPDLLPRQKWHEEHRNLQVGDLVLVADPNAPRNHWARGIVQEVRPGTDGRVRTALIKTKSNVLVRPAARLVRLPV